MEDIIHNTQWVVIETTSSKGKVMDEIFEKLENAIDSLIEARNGGITDAELIKITEDLFFIRDALRDREDDQKEENEHRDSFK